MTRRQSISNLLDRIGNGLIVSSTGKMSRELFEISNGGKHFYMQGSMGCAISIGLGLALNTDKMVHVLSGDGALLMKLGSLATVLGAKLKNLEIIVLNNNCHDSTGGQLTNFKYIRKHLPKCVKVIDIGPGAKKDLSRPNISCEQITQNFRENFYTGQKKKKNTQ